MPSGKAMIYRDAIAVPPRRQVRATPDSAAELAGFSSLWWARGSLRLQLTLWSTVPASASLLINAVKTSRTASHDRSCWAVTGRRARSLPCRRFLIMGRWLQRRAVAAARAKARTGRRASRGRKARRRAKAAGQRRLRASARGRHRPTLFDCLDALNWAEVAVTAWSVDDDRGRHELRTIQVLPARPDLPARRPGTSTLPCPCL